MKKKVSILALLLLGVYLTHFLRESRDVRYLSREKPVQMVIATDLHYLSSKLTDNGSFFTELVEDADGKNMLYIEAITDAFVDEMIELQPEILLLSGDITFNGEKQSHLDLEKKLSKIQKNGTQILIIPGNHDINRSNAAGFSGEGYEIVDTVNKGEFRKIYFKYGLQQSLHKDDNSLSYVYRVRDDLWLLLVDSNSNKENTLSQETLNWIESIGKKAKKESVKILAVSHQNIEKHHPDLTNGFLIDKSTDLEEIYEKYGIVANFSGHIHIEHINQEGVTEIVTSALSVSPH